MSLPKQPDVTDRRAINTFYEAIRRSEDMLSKKEIRPEDIFLEDARLIISPSNQCSQGCYHCVSDSIPNGEMMDFERFLLIDPSFFQLFQSVDFGRRGDPLSYDSRGHDLADMIEIMNEYGLMDYTIAGAIQRQEKPVFRRLGEMKQKRGLKIESMVTYHHYFHNFSTEQLARDMNLTLRALIQFSDRIIISILGDDYETLRTSKVDIVTNSFEENRKLIFGGIEEYVEGGRIIIPPIDRRVYPLGRFRRYLQKNGILDEYEKWFENRMGGYVCPDMIRWPGIIIEPNGDLNLCGSFEAIVCPNAVVTNILCKPYEIVRRELLEYHKDELSWFINNIEQICDGKIPSCKLQSIIT